MTVTETDLEDYVEYKVRAEVLAEEVKELRTKIIAASKAGTLPETDRFIVKCTSYPRRFVNWAVKFKEHAGEALYNRIEAATKAKECDRLNVVRVKA